PYCGVGRCRAAFQGVEQVGIAVAHHPEHVVQVPGEHIGEAGGDGGHDGPFWWRTAQLERGRCWVAAASSSGSTRPDRWVCMAIEESVRATPGTRLIRSNTSCNALAPGATTRNCMSLAPVTVYMSMISGNASARARATSSCPICWSI